VPRDDVQVTELRPPDPIEWTRHHWRRNQFGREEDAFLAMASVMRLHRLMTDTIEAALKPLRLNLTDYMLLMTLELNETRSLLISRLARNLLVHATTATLAVDRLEARGLLKRSPHPTDRRATEVSLTADGHRTVQQATEQLRGAKFGLTGTNLESQRKLVQVLDQARSSLGDDGRTVSRRPTPTP
jgi:DNA-binding MarR family transcriptional regulator